MPTAEEVRAAFRRRQERSTSAPTADDVRAAYRRRQGAPEPEQRAWPVRLAASVAEPVLETAATLRRQLASTLPEEAPYLPGGGQARERERIAALEEDLATVQETAGPEGALRTTGNIIGDVWQMAGPGGAGAAVARRVLPKALARGRPRLTAAAGEVGGIAAFEAARNPEERAEAAARGAAGTLVGQGLGAAAGKALSKATEGVRVAPESRRLLQYGATPGQVAESPVVPWMERRLGTVPGWGGIERMQEGAVRNWHLQTLQSITPGVTKVGNEGIEQAQRELGRGYDEIYKGMAQVPTTTVQTMRNIITDAGGVLDDSLRQFDDVTQQRISRFVNTQLERLARSRTPQSWQSFNQTLRDEALKYRKAGDIREAEVVENVRDLLLGLLPKNTRGRLADLNQRYRNLSVVQSASMYQPAIEAGGVFTPVELLKAARKQGSDRAVSARNAAMQREALEALPLSPGVSTRRKTFMGEQVAPSAAVLGTGYLTGGVPGMVAAGAAGVPLATQPVRRALLGQTRVQRALRPSRDQIREALRTWGGRATAAGYANE